MQGTNLRKPGLLGAVLLAPYAYAGSIKTHPLLAWMPVDLTLVLGVLLVICIMGEIIRTKSISRVILVVFAIATVMAGGVIGAVTPYGVDKTQTFYTVTLLALVSAVVLLRERVQQRAFFYSLAVMGVAVALLVGIAPGRVSEWSTVATLEGTNTISTSQMIMNGVIVIVMEAILGRRKPLGRLLLAILAVLLLLAALSTGSRGPVVSVAIAMVAGLIMAPAFKGRRWQSVLAILALGGAGIYLASRGAGEGLARVATFLSGEQDTSALARARFWTTAQEYIGSLPLGGGWGYFGTIPSVASAATETGQLYPHNFILEIALEAGWVPILAIIVLVIVAVIRLLRRSNNVVSLTLFVFLVYTIMNAMLTGDINDNRLMWIVLVAAFLVPKPPAQAEEEAPVTAAAAAR